MVPRFVSPGAGRGSGGPPADAGVPAGRALDILGSFAVAARCLGRLRIHLSFYQ